MYRIATLYQCEYCLVKARIFQANCYAIVPALIRQKEVQGNKVAFFG
jgi:hypothetical protein